MEDRKSVLETTKPSDALQRLTARRKHGAVFFLLIGVAMVLVVAMLAGLIISNATRGTSGINVPKVAR